MVFCSIISALKVGMGQIIWFIHGFAPLFQTFWPPFGSICNAFFSKRTYFQISTWSGIVQTFRTRLYVLLHDCMISLLQRIELARDFRQKEDSSFCECNSYAISKNEWRWWNIIDMDHVGIRSLVGGDYVLFFLKSFELTICSQRFWFFRNTLKSRVNSWKVSFGNIKTGQDMKKCSRTNGNWKCRASKAKGISVQGYNVQLH